MDPPICEKFEMSIPVLWLDEQIKVERFEVPESAVSKETSAEVQKSFVSTKTLGEQFGESSF
jgi:hypothetical protein